MKKFTIKYNKTNSEYVVEANDYHTFDVAWSTQKCWFSPGSEVTITNELGESRTYIKE